MTKWNLGEKNNNNVVEARPARYNKEEGGPQIK